MTHRPGVTLVEVLVAILITGIGLLSLLVLFPMGALEMAQAVKDDRTGHVKHNAAAFASIDWSRIPGQVSKLRSDPDVINAMLNPNAIPGTTTPLPYPAGAPLVPYPGTALVNYYSQPGGVGPITINPALQGVPSYPVLVDPNGYWANQPAGNSPWQDWVGGGPALNTLMPRRVCCEPFKPNSPTPQSALFPAGSTMALDPVGRRKQLLQWTTLLDDMNFPRDSPDAGRPCPGGGLVDRTPRYSWAFLCRMPKAGIGPAIPVNVSVIVYSGRAREQATNGETAFTANFGSIGSSVITLTWNAGQDPPDVSIGGWIFDATMTQPPHGYFYRVVSIDQTSATSMALELQTPLQADGPPGTVIILDNVVEVFDLRTF